jgi:hypothetical protein
MASPRVRSFFGWPPTKTALGMVADVRHKGRSNSTNGSFSTEGWATTVTIQFHDEKSHLFEITCHPVFKNFKEKSSVKVIYYSENYQEQSADSEIKEAHKKNDDVRAVSVRGIPISIFLWIEYPIIFFIIGIVLLIVRFAAIMLKSAY